MTVTFETTYGPRTFKLVTKLTRLDSGSWCVNYATFNNDFVGAQNIVSGPVVTQD